MNNKSNKNNNYKNLSCPNCKSENVIKRGKRKTQNRGLIQRLGCNKCGHRFIQDSFYRMRNSPQKITLCLDLFYRGVSTRKIQEHLQSFYPHNSSWVSIYSWVVKYSNQISSFTDGLKLEVGEELQVDEMEYNRRKSHKRKGIERNWFIDSIDPNTKFMVSSHFSNKRDTKNIKKAVKEAKEKTGNQITICTTDGFNVYEKVIKSVFGYYNLKKGIVIHNQVTALKNEGFNYPIERLHNSIRARTKVFRGFHGNLKSAQAIMKGYSIYYNFITRHQTINCSPYELACPDLTLTSNNKWLELINLSNKSI